MLCYNKSIEWLKSVLAHIRLAPELSSEKCTSVCKIGPKKYRQAEARSWASWGLYKKQAEFVSLETNHENFKVWLQMCQHVAASDASMRNPTESLCLLTKPLKRRCSRITSAASPCVMKKTSTGCCIKIISWHSCLLRLWYGFSRICKFRLKWVIGGWLWLEKNLV